MNKIHLIFVSFSILFSFINCNGQEITDNEYYYYTLDCDTIPRSIFYETHIFNWEKDSLLDIEAIDDSSYNSETGIYNKKYTYHLKLNLSANTISWVKDSTLNFEAYKDSAFYAEIGKPYKKYKYFIKMKLSNVIDNDKNVYNYLGKRYFEIDNTVYCIFLLLISDEEGPQEICYFNSEVGIIVRRSLPSFGYLIKNQILGDKTKTNLLHNLTDSIKNNSTFYPYPEELYPPKEDIKAYKDSIEQVEKNIKNILSFVFDNSVLTKTFFEFNQSENIIISSHFLTFISFEWELNDKVYYKPFDFLSIIEIQSYIRFEIVKIDLNSANIIFWHNRDRKKKIEVEFIKRENTWEIVNLSNYNR